MNATTKSTSGTGVAVGSGVLVGLGVGVLVGSGVLVGAGVLVGCGVLVPVAVGKGVFVGIAATSVGVTADSVVVRLQAVNSVIARSDENLIEASFDPYRGSGFNWVLLAVNDLDIRSS